MKAVLDPNDTAVQAAERELAGLNSQVEAMRAVLVRLLQDVVAAEKQIENSQVAQLLMVNEELVVAAMRNESEAVTAAQALDEAERQSELDPLTQLPNRMLLLDRFDNAIANARRHGSRLGLLFLDLNNFKEINDTLGHAVGDEALKLAARCLSSSIRAGDTVSRHGGDEFVVLLTEVSQASDAVVVADKMLALLGVPSSIGPHRVQLAASIGISIYPEDGEDAVTLIERADAAMYRAKRHPLASAVFHGEHPVGERRPAASEHPPQPLSVDHRATLAQHERRHALLQEANEQLVLSALGAQELQSAAESALRRQSEFLAVVADELSNPLAPIRIAAAHLGRNGTEDPLLPRAQAIIDRQAAHMKRLVKDLLDSSRSGVEKPKFDKQVVEMSAVVKMAVDACRLAMNRRHQNFVFDEPAQQIEVVGDPVRLAQVISNLLHNASKYTPDGGQIRLAMAVENGKVVVSVSDSGIGIAEDVLLTVFDPFVQDPHAIGFNEIGVGIGLTVVRELVEAHGGQVVATSAGRGRGSQFVVSLPLSGNGAGA